MATLRSLNDFIARVGAQYYSNEMYRVEIPANTSNLISGQLKSVQVSPIIHKLPSLPSGVTGYRLVSGIINSNLVGMFTLARLVNLGDLNISTNVFTAGGVMPTRTEGNTSTITSGSVILQAMTALNSAPGNMTSTYIDQSGNAAEATGVITLTPSSIIGSAAYMIFNGTDYAARQVTTAARTAGTTPTGTIRHWGVDGIGNASVIIAGQAAQFNFLTANPAPPLFAPNDEFYIISENSLNAKHMHGSLTFVAEQA